MAISSFDDFRHLAESDPVGFMLTMQPGGQYNQSEGEYYAANPKGPARPAIWFGV